MQGGEGAHCDTSEGIGGANQPFADEPLRIGARHLLGQPAEGGGAAVMVCSVQAFARGVQRKGKGEGVADYLKQAFDYIIIDEAHHALAPSYRLLWDFYPKAKKLGVTATPYRLKRGSFMELFEKLIVSYAISGYIEQGYLADYELYTASARKAALQKTKPG